MAAEESEQGDIEPYTGKRTEFPERIGKTARRVLALEGYTRYEELTTTTPRDLLKIHGMGPKGVAILHEELTSRGMSFADGS